MTRGIVFSTIDEATGACESPPSAMLLRFRNEADRDAFERALRRATNLDQEGVDFGD